MDPSEFWIRFFLASLVTWRVSHLLASEDGPGAIVARLRSRLGDSVFGRLADCFGCLSVWIAIPLAFFVSEGALNLVMTWLALSGAAFLLERMSPEPVVIERLPETSGGD
ncbi:MAG TPA: DUF1360 domain-containing protein [Roseiarcus sp.]|jgi:hypothetical protein|nr:DUF1360 domain-containing protein [Roseiarcus sp.]